MKTQVRSFLLLALAVLLVKAQTSSELNYEDTIVGLFTKKDAEGRTFRPLLEDIQVDTLSPEDVDGSAVGMKSLSFLAQETMCRETQEQQGKPCPLKQNGQLLLCNLGVSHPVQDITKIITSEMSCEQLEPEDDLEVYSFNSMEPKIRTRRGFHRWLKKKGRKIRHWVKKNGDKIKKVVTIIQGIKAVAALV